MKLKTFKRTVETEETNIELPAYFYIQGDGFEEEWIKIEGLIKENGVIGYFLQIQRRDSINPYKLVEINNIDNILRLLEL